MRILFVRHGESVDDLTDQYGGWGDFPLTPKGVTQITEVSKKIAKMDINFECIYSSPLSRADQSARIIANELSIPLYTFHYLKEKNGNGILSGLNRSEAALMYPELAGLGPADYIPGAEPHDKFIERVKSGIDLLTKKGHENIIALTHGGFLKVVFETLLEKNFTEAHDGSYVLLNIVDNNFEIIEFNNIDFS